MKEAEGKLNFREKNGIAQPYVGRHECSHMHSLSV